MNVMSEATQPTDELLTEPHISNLVASEMRDATSRHSQIDDARKEFKDYVLGWYESELDGKNARTEKRA